MTLPSPRAEIRDQAALCLDTLDLVSRARRISGSPGWKPSLTWPSAPTWTR